MSRNQISALQASDAVDEYRKAIAQALECYRDIQSYWRGNPEVSRSLGQHIAAFEDEGNRIISQLDAAVETIDENERRALSQEGANADETEDATRHGDGEGPCG